MKVKNEADFKQTKNENVFSLRGIVEECTGVKSNDNAAFDSAYQNVKNIVKAIENYIGSSLPPITDEFKSTLIKLIRLLYLTKSDINILAHMRKSKAGSYQLNSFESLEWQLVGLLKLVEEYSEISQPESVTEILLKQSKEFQELHMRINECILKDLLSVACIDDEVEKIWLLQKYYNVVEDEQEVGSLSKWRSLVFEKY